MPVRDDVALGAGTVIHHPELVNLYGCRLGTDCRVGPFVEIQEGVIVGDRCKIESHSFVCTGVVIEDDVFVGHGVQFTNDRFPRSSADGRLLGGADWVLEPTRVCRGASIGSGSVILPGLVIGPRALVGAGAVVTRDVPEGAVVDGNPARVREP